MQPSPAAAPAVGAVPPPLGVDGGAAAQRQACAAEVERLAADALAADEEPAVAAHRAGTRGLRVPPVVVLQQEAAQASCCATLCTRNHLRRCDVVEEAAHGRAEEARGELAEAGHRRGRSETRSSGGSGWDTVGVSMGAEGCRQRHGSSAGRPRRWGQGRRPAAAPAREGPPLADSVGGGGCVDEGADSSSDAA